ncbi:MAG: SET domain-containing protein [Deltaproteobacteria bacterium]|nr:SET domain-containing protein [Deltaproteobacteria bacterium]
MLYVKTKLAPSEIHGIGLFADEFIPKGAVIWKFTSGFDLKFTEEEISRLPKQAQEYLSIYSYLSLKSGLRISPVDNGKYINHSETPNTLSQHSDYEEEVLTYAIIDIQVGEEITENYHSFEDWDGKF